jgi:ParB family transcriptional regulator, chromosome partitioning protein
VSRRSGLGRGLAALIPPSVPEASEEPATDDASPSGAPARREEPAPTDDAAAADDSEASSGTTPPDPDEEASDGTSGIERTSNDPRDPGPEAVPDPVSETPPTTVEAASTAPVVPEIVTPLERPAASTDVDPTPIANASVPDTGRVPSAAATLAEVAPASISPNPRQPREVFDPDEIAHLATSLADVGVLQPLVVRPLADGRYELVAGERRLRAATLAGLVTVPVVIRHTDDADLLKEALVENIHRVQLNPLEEGAAYQQLLEEFGVTQEELATRLGRSRPAISNAIRLLQLPSGVQRRVASGVLSAGHAKVLLAIEDPDQQVRLADRIVAEGMSVRATEELVRLRLLDEPSTSSSPRRKPATAPGLVELQDDLSDALEARVRISMGAKRGKLAIEFASVDDLERIVSVIANGLEGGRVLPPTDPAATGDGHAADPG